MDIDIRALLDELNQKGEHERLEAKRASEMGKSVLETVCAFSNTPGLGGGYLLLGVVRDSASLFPSYVVEGIADPEKVSADLGSKCRSMFNVAVRPTVQVERFGDRAVIGVFVPEAEASRKPVYFEATGTPKGAWRRSGPTDQRYTSEEIEELYRLRPGRPYDQTTVSDATLDDLDPNAIAVYRRERGKIEPSAAELAGDDAHLLQSLRLVRRDAAGAWRPTVAALLLFGTRAALRGEFPMVKVDYLRIPGRTWVEDPMHRFDALPITGPIFDVIYRTEAAILDDVMRRTSIPAETGRREEAPILPRNAVREAVVNALMHRSYERPYPVQVRRFSDRIEIENPGYSLKPLDELGTPGPAPRNPSIADVLHETPLAESKGSGIKAMRKAMTDADLTLPEFSSDRDLNRFIVTLYLHHFLEPADLAWLARFPELSQPDRLALLHARNEGRITNSDYRSWSGMDTPRASRRLRALRGMGLLDANEGGADTWYSPSSLLLQQAVPRKSVSETRESSNQTRETPGETRESSSQSRESGLPEVKPRKGSLAERLLHQDHALEAHEVPDALRSEIRALGRKPDHRVLEDVIVAVCAWRSFSAADLADIFARRHDDLRDRYLTPLMRAGRLRHTIQNVPNSRYQRYATVKNADGVGDTEK